MIKLSLEAKETYVRRRTRQEELVSQQSDKTPVVVSFLSLRVAYCYGIESV